MEDEEKVKPTETPPVEQSPETPKPVEVSQPNVKPVDDEYINNVISLREGKLKAEREAQQLRAEYEKLKEAQKYKISDDDIPEGSHINHLEQTVNDRMSQLDSKIESMNIRNSLIATRPDFQKVYTTENLEKLRQLKPELFNTINTSTDMYGAGASAYDAIKLFVENDAQIQEQKKNIVDNLNKPKTAAQINSASPLAYVNSPTRKWSQEERDQNYRNRKKSGFR